MAANPGHLHLVGQDENWVTHADARANVLEMCAEAYADCQRQLVELDNDLTFGGSEWDFWAERARISTELAEYAEMYARMFRHDAVETIKHVREGNGHGTAS